MIEDVSWVAHVILFALFDVGSILSHYIGIGTDLDVSGSVFLIVSR